VSPPPRVLVAGAAGFVGAQIVRELSSRELEIRTTDCVAKPRTELPSYRPADLRNPDQVRPVVDGVDCVINASGIAHVFRLDEAAAKTMREVNGDAAGTLARAAVEAGVAHLVQISSVSVYGSPGVPSVDETFSCNPTGVYEESKYEGELLSLAAVKGTGTRLTILRPATIYGPGDRGNVARLVRALDKGRFVWIGDGLNLKSLLYHEDFARACVRAALEGTESDIYNISAPAETMHSVVDAIAEALGKRPPRLFIPAACARSAAAVAALSPVARTRFQGLRRTLRKWLAHDAYDAGKFVRRFGDFVQVPLREGMRREVEWHVAHR